MSNEEESIRALLTARADAVATGDVDAIIASVEEDIAVFDMFGPLRSGRKSSVRERTAEWLELYEAPPRWEDRDVTVAASGDVAFAHSLGHVTGRRKDGVDVDMWFRTTLGLRRVDDEWRIVHEHQSEPFDIDSGKASLDLKP